MALYAHGNWKEEEERKWRKAPHGQNALAAALSP